MRRPASGRDAVRSQVIATLEAQEVKETGKEEGKHCNGEAEQKFLSTEANDWFGSGRSIELVLRIG